MADDRNPYTPPAANVEIADRKRGPAVKAVLLGLAADVGGTLIFSTIAAIVYGTYMAAAGSTPDQMTSAMTNIPFDSPLGIVMTMIGCLFSVLGGYVCARTARHSEYKLGLVMFAASMVLLVLTGGNHDSPAIATAGLVLATFASIMVGVHIGVQRNRRA